MSGWLHRLVGTTLFVGAGALVTHLLPLGIAPGNAAEARYVRNALEMRRFLNSHPMQRGFDLVVLRTSVSDLRLVPGSCSEGQPDIAGLEDVVATVTDYTIFGLAMARYQVSCAGNAISRGATDHASRRKLPPPAEGEPFEATITAPPPR